MPRSQSRADADQLERPALEARVVAPRQTENARDDLHGEREGELADQLGASRVREAVDELSDDGPNELGLPARERLVPERLRDEAAMVAVLGLVHLEDRVAHHRAHHLGVDLRRERVVVAQHLRHELEAVHRVDVGHVDRRLTPSAKRLSFCTGARRRASARSGHGSRTSPARSPNASYGSYCSVAGSAAHLLHRSSRSSHPFADTDVRV